ncbi:MAG TPA: M56 family metallopeptidase [Verrucomicrobiae bacterium]|nr:M56 family metallopeptidase [Verrucomicrobiae bacterium]
MNLSAGLTGFIDFLPLSLAIAAAAWLLMRLTPRMNAATRHAIWWLVLALVVLLPAGFALHDAGNTASVARTRFVAVPRAADADAADFAPSVPVAPIPQTPTFAPAAAPAPRPALEIRGGNWARGLIALWALIFAVLLIRLALSYSRLRGLKRRAHPALPELQQRFRQWMAAWDIRRNARLLISEEAASPLAAGFFHPAVIVPARLLGEFSPAELDHVLMHELTHLARRDDWGNLVCRIAHAALWFHPAALLALRRIEREREMACDERVVSATGAARPYAASLARLFEFCVARRRDALASGMAGHGSHLGERIEVLMRRKNSRRGGVSILLLAACALALIFVVAITARAPRWVVLAQDRWDAPPAPPAPPRVRAIPAAPLPPVAPLPFRADTVPAPPAPSAGEPPDAPAPPSEPPADPHSFLAALVAAGYGDLSVDEIIELRNSGVSAAYLMAAAKSGFGKLNPREIINLHNSGVSTEFLRAAADANIPGLTIQGVIDLNNSGVGGRYLAALQSAGAGGLSKGDIINLHNNGVKPELIAALNDAGFTHLDVRDIIDANNSGVRPEDLREARKYGSNLTIKQVIKLKQAGVI